jgi:hypothetical protein
MIVRRTGHIRERSPGSFELRCSLGTDPATGKRKVATLTICGTRKDAEKELRRLLHAVDTGQHVDPSRVRVGEFVRARIAQWKIAGKKPISAKTAERYRELVENQSFRILGPRACRSSGRVISRAGRPPPCVPVVAKTVTAVSARVQLGSPSGPFESSSGRRASWLGR